MKAHKDVEQHFLDRTKAPVTSFVAYSDKLHGVGTGYVAKDSITNFLYMIKAAVGASSIQFARDLKIVDQSGNNAVVRQGKIWSGGVLGVEDCGFINEFVTAPLYKRILYDRAPIISLVKCGDEDDKECANDLLAKNLRKEKYQFQESDVKVVRLGGGQILSFLRSKYLHGFEEISKLTGGGSHNLVGNNRDVLNGVEGVEKLFAAMLFMGELDINAGNIGVMTLEDGRRVFAKIDHAWSATRFFTDPNKMLLSLANSLSVYHYESVIYLDPKRLKEEIDKILEISDEEIRCVVKARLYELEKANVDLKDRNFGYWNDDIEHDSRKNTYTIKRYNSYEELEDFWIEAYRLQKTTFQGLSKILDVISKIEGLGDKWLTKIGDRDPVEYAILGDLKISGQEAIVWAVDNGYKIGDKEPFQKFKPSARWLAKQFENLDLNFQRVCNLWRFCSNSDLKSRIAKKAIMGGVKFYGEEAIKYLKSNDYESQAWADSQLNKEVISEKPDINVIQKLLNSGAFPSDDALKVMLEKSMPVLICGKSPKIYQQVLHLDRFISSKRQEVRDEKRVIDRMAENIAGLVAKECVVSGLYAVEHAVEKFPDLRLCGVGIADFFSLLVSNIMPRATTVLDDSDLNIMCSLFSAGVRMHKDKSVVLAKILEERSAQSAVDGNEPKRQCMNDGK